ncbi:MAG: hypothetical protein GF341_05935 [candidate division Zixibacteria bacterium]|nr:hypothetical protein [candidate division Zixibacteria bacterium]
MPDQTSWWQRVLARIAPPPENSLARPEVRSALLNGLKPKTRSQRPEYHQGDWMFATGAPGNRPFAIRLHRFLRDHIPILKSVVWTWTRLAVSPHRFEIVGDVDAGTRERAEAVLDALDRRIYPERVVRFGGFDALLIQFFNTLFTDGAVAGELSLLPSRKGLDRFDFIDTASLDFKPDTTGHWRLEQIHDDRRINLDSAAIFYLPLDADAGRPAGKSLLGAVGFVSRIEQELVRDMQRAMSNAGYHRLHVSIRPPAQAPGELDDDYTARANSYFDATTRALRDLDVDDNPITWDDVDIEHVGPSGQISGSRNWYLNHRAMIEDVIAGCHLAPFMLGYSYGTTQTWARFKYEMVGRQIATLQRAASRFCEWIAGIELALAGVDVPVRHTFDNRLEFDRRERFEADRAEMELVLRQMEAGLVNVEDAKRRLGLN